MYQLIKDAVTAALHRNLFPATDARMYGWQHAATRLDRENRRLREERDRLIEQVSNQEQQLSVVVPTCMYRELPVRLSEDLKPPGFWPSEQGTSWAEQWVHVNQLALDAIIDQGTGEDGRCVESICARRGSAAVQQRCLNATRTKLVTITRWMSIDWADVTVS